VCSSDLFFFLTFNICLSRFSDSLSFFFSRSNNIFFLLDSRRFSILNNLLCFLFCLLQLFICFFGSLFCFLSVCLCCFYFICNIIFTLLPHINNRSRCQFLYKRDKNKEENKHDDHINYMKSAYCHTIHSFFKNLVFAKP